MAIFNMMVGLPGSGKSYFTKYLAETEQTEIVSSDEIRKELFGDENDQEHNAEVFNEVHNRIYTALRENRNVCYDATNLSRKRRKSFLNTFNSIKNVEIIKRCYVITTHYDTCRLQNQARSRVVPGDVIFRMFQHINLPRIDEGWDRIEFIGSRNLTSNTNIDYYWSHCLGYDQDNPNHTLYLDTHMEKAAEYIDTVKHAAKNYEYLREAALYHDIGKPVCKTYQNFKGTIDDHAHYYNHAEVGAYILACCLSTKKPIVQYKECPLFHNPELEKILLVQWHMEFFNQNTDVLDTVTKLYGTEFANDLRLLHLADTNAH